VPCNIRWLGKIAYGKVNNLLFAGIDLFPTITSITRGQLSSNKIDGHNQSQMLFDADGKTQREDFLYYYASNELRAVRKGQWKLMLAHTNNQSYENALPGNDRNPGVYNVHEVPQALYDLRRDPGERYDVQKQNLAILNDLIILAQKAREDMGDILQNKMGQFTRSPGQEK
jgi:arylsulfatase A-like enzyme